MEDKDNNCLNEKNACDSVEKKCKKTHRVSQKSSNTKNFFKKILSAIKFHKKSAVFAGVAVMAIVIAVTLAVLLPPLFATETESSDSDYVSVEHQHISLSRSCKCEICDEEFHIIGADCTCLKCGKPMEHTIDSWTTNNTVGIKTGNAPAAKNILHSSAPILKLW